MKEYLASLCSFFVIHLEPLTRLFESLKGENDESIPV